MPYLGGGTVVGPLLMGLTRPVQIVNIGATVSDLVNLAALAAHDAAGEGEQPDRRCASRLAQRRPKISSVPANAGPTPQSLRPEHGWTPAFAGEPHGEWQIAQHGRIDSICCGTALVS